MTIIAISPSAPIFPARPSGNEEDGPIDETNLDTFAPPAGPDEMSAVAGGSKAPPADHSVETFDPVMRWGIFGILLLMCVFGLAYARDFLMPVVLAFMLTMVFSPVRRFLERRGIPCGASAFLIVGVLVVGLVSGGLGLAAPIAGWIERAPSIGREIDVKISGMMGAAEQVTDAIEQVNEIAKGGQAGDVPTVAVREPGVAAEIVLLAPKVFGQCAFTLILLLFLLASGDMFYEKLVHVLPNFKDKRRAISIARDIERKLSRYLFTITVINAGLGLAIGLAMWALSMPNPVLFGVSAFLLNYIPYLGAAVGGIVAGLVALVTFPEPASAFLAAAVYLGLTGLEGQLVTPYFVGRSLQLNTVVVFLSVTLWAWLWSVVGMLVAMPMLVVARTFCEHIPALEGVGHFLSARGAEAEGRPPDQPG